MKINDGGPAFPFVTNNVIWSGISLRDYLAGRALTGVIGLNIIHEDDDIARRSYRYADAMLKARESK